MHHLAPELLELIFKNLNYLERLECKLVCKKFRAVILNMPEESLVVLPEIDHLNQSYFYTNRPIKYDQIILSSVSSDVNFLNRITKSKYSNLKRLFLDSVGRDLKIDFENQINRFKGLEELNLKGGFLSPNSVLNLPKLKILYLDVNTNGFELRIDCKNLSILKVNNLDNYNSRYELVHKDSIEYLESGNASTIVDLIELLKEFRSLKYLVGNDESFRGLDISMIPSLKELHINHFREFSNYYSARWNSPLNSLYRDICGSGRDDLKMFICGLDYEIFNKNKKYLDKMSLTSFYLNFYSNLKGVLTLSNVYYNDSLFLKFKNRLEDGFFAKFKNIEQVYATKIKKNGYFFEFLRKCDILNDLELKHTFDNQRDYDKLPNYCPFINNLIIHLDTKKFNLDFLLKFKYLAYLEIGGSLQEEQALKLFKNLRHLKDVQFYFARSRVTISKLKEDIFTTDYSETSGNMNFIYEQLEKKHNKRNQDHEFGSFQEYVEEF